MHEFVTSFFIFSILGSAVPAQISLCPTDPETGEQICPEGHNPNNWDMDDEDGIFSNSPELGTDDDTDPRTPQIDGVWDS